VRVSFSYIVSCFLSGLKKLRLGDRLFKRSPNLFYSRIRFDAYSTARLLLPLESMHSNDRSFLNKWEPNLSKIYRDCNIVIDYIFTVVGR
jgi:hypothetical protein